MHNILSKQLSAINSSTIITKLIIGPRAIDRIEPVTSQAISSQALEIDIPAFNDTDGPIRYYSCIVDVHCYYFDSVSYYSHYFIVIINATVQDTPSAVLVEDDTLHPHDPSSRYYVAAVLRPNDYHPDMPFMLGTKTNTSFEGIRYQNVPLTLGTYRYFVRAVTIGPVSPYKLSISYHIFVLFT